MNDFIYYFAVSLVCLGLYTFGQYQGRKSRQFEVDNADKLIQHLMARESELLNSLYQRINFKPEKPQPVVVGADKIAPNNSPDDKVHKSKGFPDLYARRHEAFAAEMQREKEKINGIL